MLFRSDDYPADAGLLQDIESRFGLEGSGVLRYDDKRRGNARHILVRDGKLMAVALAGDTSAGQWLKAYLEGEQPVATLGRLLLQPSAKPPQGFKARGKIVCNCFNVAETEIAGALERHDWINAGSPEAALADVKARLKCGTNCGSCIPELKQCIAAGSRAAQAG